MAKVSPTFRPVLTSRMSCKLFAILIIYIFLKLRHRRRALALPGWGLPPLPLQLRGLRVGAHLHRQGGQDQARVHRQRAGQFLMLFNFLLLLQSIVICNIVAPLNVFSLGPRESDSTNQLITIAKQIPWLADCKKHDRALEILKNEQHNWMVTLPMITLSGCHCTNKTE